MALIYQPPADDHAFTSGKKTTPTQKPTPTVHQKNDGACNGSNLSTDAVQQFLTKTVDDCCKEKWAGKLILPVIPIYNNIPIEQSLCQGTQDIDVCQYLNGAYPNVVALHFCPKQYKPPANGPNYQPSKNLKKKKAGDTNFKYDCIDDRIFSDLRDYIERVSVAMDCSVICNGQNGSAKNTRKFVCKEIYRLQQDNKEKAPGEYRQTYMINNDKRGRRKDGKKGPRKTAVSDTTQGICPLKFLLKWDSHGYFIELRRNAGCGMHEFHPMPVPNSTPLPARLLTEEEIETVKHITDATFNNGCGRNYLFQTLGKHLSRAKVAYITGQKDEDKDEIERMFEFMENSEDVSYNILWDPAASEDGNSGKPTSLVYPKDKALPSDLPSLVSTTKEDGNIR